MCIHCLSQKEALVSWLWPTVGFYKTFPVKKQFGKTIKVHDNYHLKKQCDALTE